MDEPAFIAALRALATDPAARGLADDAAVLGDLVLTHDMLVEGVHFLADDPPEDVAWKLLAVNLSDLAAKGARPIGVLLGFPLGDADWDRRFVAGLGEALAAFDVPLLGGDTVRGPRVLGLTALGRAAIAPSRSGAREGDRLWVTGTIGDAGAGLSVLLRRQEPRCGGRRGSGLLPAQEHELVEAYRRPVPRLIEGQALARHVHAMMDVSDGLLIDAGRMAAASGLGVEIDIAAIPLSAAFVEARGDDRAARLFAATAGDDYQLLFAAPDAAAQAAGVAATPIGRFGAGAGIGLREGNAMIPLPERLGWVHD